MRYRDRFIADIKTKDEESRLVIAGRLSSLRDHGGILFAHVIDGTGELQVRFDPSELPKLDVQVEDWVSVTGRLMPRPGGTENANVSLPDHEFHVESVRVYGRLSDRLKHLVPALDGAVSEEHTLKFRPYALRRRDLQTAIRTRAQIMAAMRDYLTSQRFCEVETPILAAPAPEGARDFLVPSRTHPGCAYALPQSPQMYKQLLMIGGFDRYYQVARCFRDEDLRSNRQPEFTQLDLEMSFVNEQDVIDMVTNLLRTVIKRVRSYLPPDATHTFTSLSYEEVMRRYGTDSPDLRVPYELVDLSSTFKNTGFEVFRGLLELGGAVWGIPVPSANKLGRKKIDRLREWAVEERGFPAAPAWGDLKEGIFESTIRKHFSEEEAQELAAKMEEGGQLFFVADEQADDARKNAGLLRVELGKRAGLLKNKDQYKWVWVTDFPAFKQHDHKDRSLRTVHHPFTDFLADLPLGELDDEWLGYRSRAYDIVLNGEELGSGSIRIHSLDKQRRVFQQLGYDSDGALESFRHLFLGLECGAPPHGGIAIGIDRLTSGLLGLESIRGSIAFPKDGHGHCVLSQSPRHIDGDQWDQLGLTRLDEASTGQLSS